LVLTAVVRTAILAQRPERLTRTLRGYRVGRGEVWIDVWCAPNARPTNCRRFGIVAIDVAVPHDPH
jgi:hypothetical protein